MKAKKLVLCILLSVALAVTFIPVMSYGYTPNEPQGTIAISGWTPDEGGLTWTDPDTGTKATFSCDNYFSDEGCIANVGDRVWLHISNVPEGMYVAKVASSGGFVNKEGRIDYSFAVEPDDESGIGNVITIEIEDVPTIDECGTVVVAGDGWVLDPESPGTTWMNEEEAYISFNGDEWNFDGDDYAHYIIGDEVNVVVEPPEGKWVGSVKVNGVECDMDVQWSYCFDVVADKTEGPGNVITVSFVDEFDFDALDEAAKAAAAANTLEVGQEKTADTTSGDAFFLFEPESDGKYVFYSDAGDSEEPDPIGRVLDEDGNPIAVNDDENSEAYDFAVYFYAQAGHKYYLQAKACSKDATFTVGLERNNVTKIVFVPKTTTLYSEDIETSDEDETYLDLCKREAHSVGEETWFSRYAVGDKLTVYYDDAPAKTYVNKNYSYTEEDSSGNVRECWDDAFICGDEMIFPNMWNENDPDFGGDALAAGKNTVTVGFCGCTTTFDITVETTVDEYRFDALDEAAKAAAAVNTLEVGQEKTADTTAGDAFFLFEPERDGKYVFYSDAGDGEEPDPIGRVLDEDGNPIAVNDDDNTDTYDFAVHFYAQAGHKYYLQAKAYSENATFTVGLERNNVTKIVFAPKTTTLYSEEIKTSSDEDGTYLDLWKREEHSAGESTWYSCYAVGDELTVYYDDAPAKTYVNKNYSYTEEDSSGNVREFWDDAFFCGDEMIFPDLWNEKDLEFEGNALAAGKNTVTVGFYGFTTSFDITVETPESRAAEEAARKAREAQAAAAAAEAARQGVYSASMPAAKASKPKAAKKSITVKWKKLKKKQLKSGVSNIEIWVSTNTAFARGATIEKTVGKKKASIKIKGLQKGVTYYAKVRTIKYVNGQKVVGKWSGTKKVKVKK